MSRSPCSVPTGAGKTSVLRALVGLHAPSAGRVLIGGVDMARAPDEAKTRLSFVPQRVSLPGMLTAREILTLFARLKKAPLERVGEVLEEFELAGRAPTGGPPSSPGACSSGWAWRWASCGRWTCSSSTSRR